MISKFIRYDAFDVISPLEVIYYGPLFLCPIYADRCDRGKGQVIPKGSRVKSIVVNYGTGDVFVYTYRDLPLSEDGPEFTFKFKLEVEGILDKND